jgi:hypothetical protein
MVSGAPGYAGLGTTSSLSYDLTTGVLGNTRIAISGNTSATSTSTGALTVVGGVGIGGDVYIGGTLSVSYVSTASNIRGGGPGQVPYQINTGTTGFFGGALSTAGNVLISNGTSAPSYNNTLTLAGITTASSTQTGALVVAGGVGIGGNLYVGGEIVAQKLTIEFTTVTTTLVQTDDIIRTYNATASTSTNSGALQITGGAGIGGDLWVGGTIHVLNAVIQKADSVNGGSTGTVLFQNASSSTAFTNVGNTGDVFISRGINVLGPQFVSTTTLVVGYATTALNVSGNLTASTATNLAGGTTNQIPYQSTASTTLFFGPGTTGQLLVSRGTQGGGPVFTNTSSIFVGYATTALNVLSSNSATFATTATSLEGGTAGQVPYQLSPGTTRFFGPGTAGNVLVSNGTSAPSYNNTLTLTAVTSASSTMTGAFQVRGGAGIGGDLYVGGSIYGLQEITAYYGTPSDIRLKTNISTIHDGLAKVLTLNGITYNWNDLATNQNKESRESGIIAQELLKVLPEAVVEKDDGFLTVKYDRIIPLLIEAIKELSIEVEILKKKIQ